MENNMMLRVRNYPVLMLPGPTNGGTGSENTLPKGVGTTPEEQDSCKPYTGPWCWLFNENAKILGDWK